MSDKTTEPPAADQPEKKAPAAPAASTSSTSSTSSEAARARTEKDAAAAKQRRQPPSVDVAKVRTLVARVLWAVCVLAALVLAAAVLLIALDAREQNELVVKIQDLATQVDLGFFSLDNPVKKFDDLTKTALFNYGIAAVVWLVVGRVLDRVVRP